MIPNTQNEYQNCVEIIKDRLYWICSEDTPTDISYFNVDDKIKYIKYYKDFGPAPIANVANFCRILRKYMFENEQFRTQKLYFHSSIDREKQANAAFLICSFEVVVLKRSPEETWEKIRSLNILPFRDASYSATSDYECTILDCLLALRRAIELHWFSLDEFDIKEYERLENLETGNISVIIPNKIIAFRGPLSDQRFEALKQSGKCFRIPVKQLCVELKKMKTESVVRCNSSEEYDKQEIIEQGIQHFDLTFPDGSCPTQEIIDKFKHIIDSSTGYIGVHCKAGLGRTGTLIGCYVIEKYNFPSNEFIAWMRLCRSGSILGKQQLFLEEFGRKLIEQKKIKNKQLEMSVNQDNNQIQKKVKTEDIKEYTKKNSGFRFRHYLNCFTIFKHKQQNLNKENNILDQHCQSLKQFDKKNANHNHSNESNLKSIAQNFYLEEPNQANILLAQVSNYFRDNKNLLKVVPTQVN